MQFIQVHLRFPVSITNDNGNIHILGTYIFQNLMRFKIYWNKASDGISKTISDFSKIFKTITNYTIYLFQNFSQISVRQKIERSIRFWLYCIFFGVYKLKQIHLKYRFSLEQKFPTIHLLQNIPRSIVCLVVVEVRNLNKRITY